MVLASVSVALQRADELKAKLQSLDGNLLKSSIIFQQQLQRLYHQILILDLDYALNKKVEQDLWVYGFLNVINPLKQLAKDNKNPDRKEFEGMLQSCLDSASGYFLCLLQEICAAFNLDMPFRRDGNAYGCQEESSIPKNLLPSKTSCIYICQFCLIHLGDIARYKKQMRQAESFYLYAVDLAPTNGMPYNQLAILEASRGDKIGAVFHYVRATYVRYPFPAASTNLTSILSKYINDESIDIEGHLKLSPDEYLNAFLKLFGLLFSSSHLELAEKIAQNLITCLTAHIATESISTWRLVQTIVIIISATSKSPIDTDDKKTDIVCQYVAGCLNAFLLPVYTMQSPEQLSEYFALPAIKVILDWLRCNPTYLNASAFKNLLQIWPSLSKLLNDSQPVLEDFPSSKYVKIPLMEDWDVRGFLPLEKYLFHWDFTNHSINDSSEDLITRKLRLFRLCQLGCWISERQDSPIIKSETNGKLEFAAANKIELPNKLIKEFEELSLANIEAKSAKIVNLSTTGTSTPDSANSQENSQVADKKPPGILKVQEKSGGKSISRRSNRNVALNAIINNRVSEEMKQVTFKTPDKEDTGDRKRQSKQQTKITTREENNKKGQESENTQSTSSSAGVLTLTKQQQEQMLNTQVTPTKSTSHARAGKVVDRMEAARRDYEAAAAMVVLQQQQQQQQISFPNQQMIAPSYPSMHQQQQHFQPPIARPLMADYHPPPQTQPQPLYIQNSGVPGLFSGGFGQLGPTSPQITYNNTNNSPLHSQQQPSQSAIPSDVPFPWAERSLPPPPAHWWTSFNSDQQQPHVISDQPSSYPPSTISYTPYSLFSGDQNYQQQQQHRSNVSAPVMSHQSLWVGPGPSPLERLLEQQRQLNMQTSPNHHYRSS